MEGHIEKAEKFVGDGLDKAKAAAMEKAEEAKKKVMWKTRKVDFKSS